MRNPFRPVLNLSWAAIAALVLAPVVFGPPPAYARGGGGRGGSGGGGNGGGSRGNAGKNAKSKNGQGKNSQVKNAGEYLLVLQQQDALDSRAEFIFQAREDATQDARDKDRAATLAANREKESRQLRADDMPRP